MRAAPGYGNTPAYLIEIGQESYFFYNGTVIPYVGKLWEERCLSADEMTIAYDQVFSEILRQLVGKLCKNYELYLAEIKKLPYLEYLIGGDVVTDYPVELKQLKEGTYQLGMALWFAVRPFIDLGETDDYVLERATPEHILIIKLDTFPETQTRSIDYAV